MARDAVQERARLIVEEFSPLEDWIERYRYLIDMGEQMPRIVDDDKTEENYIPGCQYDIWIRADYDPEHGILRFQADSDAKITRGLAALIIRVLDGQPPEAIVNANFDFLDTIGLRAHLSSQRNNGLSAMIHQMRSRARSWQGGEGEPEK